MGAEIDKLNRRKNNTQRVTGVTNTDGMVKDTAILTHSNSKGKIIVTEHET